VETLTKEGVLEDIQIFQDILEKRFSYFFLEHGDYLKALGAIRDRSSGLDRNILGNLLQKVLTLFIDGHAQVSHVLRVSGDLPFMPVAYGDKVLARTFDGTSFVENARPYLTKIDGKAINAWAGLAQNLLPNVSPQFVWWRSVDLLRRIQHWRLESGQGLKGTVEVELSDGVKTTTRTLEVLPKSQPRPKRTEKESGLLDKNIGYLRLAKMDEEAVQVIQTWLPTFKNTDGLIVDVRGNGGGSREALRELFPYFIVDGEPVVASVAVYRLHEDVRADHLAHRFMYSLASLEWTDAERLVVEEFHKTFNPIATFPKEKFSDWHYLLLSKKTNPEAYFYQKPVVILMDTACFSATDVFLGAMKGRKNITLLGQPSSGGSGFALMYDLPKAGLKFRVASMLSFQPNGQLYDTLGIQPDVFVLPGLEDFISDSDAVLTQAIQHI
jgi:Peptidase family S41